MEDGKSDLVVVVGGSGYLGLHLLAELAKCHAHKYRVAYTYHSQPPSPQLQQHLPNVKSFQVDLVSGHGLDSISSALGFVSHHPSAYV
jgi:nucleoside-diphosphate-sugar epimerase